MPVRKAKKRAPAARSRGSIEARGKGKWLIRAHLGTDPATGKRKYTSQTVTGGKKDANEALTKMLREVDTGTFIEPSRQTVAEYLTFWLDHIERQEVSPRTLDDHRRTLRRYVFPALGHLRLDRLSHQEIQRLYNGMKDERGLSPNTIRLAHAPLRKAMRYAVRTGLLLRCPSDFVVLPKMERKARQVLTMEQADLFLETVRSDDLFALWVLLLTTGMRPGEALGLKWEDYTDGRIHVNRALSRVGPGKNELSETKTKGSRRRISLPPATVEALNAHRVKQGKEMLKAGSRYTRQGYIFANSAGQTLDPSRVSKLWKKHLKAAKLPPLRLYDLRHTHATHLFQTGESAKLVQERLGHSSITLTLDTYTHVLPEMEDGLAERIGNLYGSLAATG